MKIKLTSSFAENISQKLENIEIQWMRPKGIVI